MGMASKSISHHFRVYTNSDTKIEGQIKRWVTESLKEHHEAYEYLKS